MHVRACSLATLAGAVLIAAASQPARAGTVTFDFATLGANGTAVCASNCVLPTLGTSDFTLSGVTVAATGYSSATATSVGSVAYLTQKPGSISTGETGLGESDTSPTSSDPQYEIMPGKAVVLDNTQAIAKGYTPESITIGSIQYANGENANVYGGSTQPGSPGTLLGNVTGTSSSAVQTLALAKGDTFVTVEGVTGNVVLMSEAFSVPEPTSLAVLGVGLAGLIAARRRRR